MLDKQIFGSGQHLTLVLISLSILLAGCSDPYEAKLPTSARLTPGEIEKITERLELADQTVFKRWAERHAKGEEFGGEGSAPTVRAALMNQATLDTRQKMEVEAAKAQKALDDEVARKKEDVARQQRAQADHVAVKRQEVDAEIRKFFNAQAIGYDWRPLSNSRGLEVAREWVFKLRLTNKSTKEIVGTSGWATISDVFNTDLGSYPMKIEPVIKPGQTIEMFITMDYDRKNPKHVEMSQTKSLRVTWFFESVAFQDGTNVDYKSIAGNAPLSIPTRDSTKKSPSL